MIILDVKLYSPEATAAVHHQCMSHIRVAEYFRQLQEVLKQNPPLVANPDYIWNLDKSRFCLVHNPGKIIARCADLQEKITLMGSFDQTQDDADEDINVMLMKKKIYVGDVVNSHEKQSWHTF